MLTHGAGALLSLVGLAVLLARSLWYRDAVHTVAVGVYGASLVAVFVASTLHHAATAPRLKQVTLWLDHACIYALIAGTYTPFMLTVLKGATGLAMLGAVWTLAAVGIVAKTVLRIRSEAISLPFYLLMGWLIVVVIEPFARQVPAERPRAARRRRPVLLAGRGLLPLAAPLRPRRLARLRPRRRRPALRRRAELRHPDVGAPAASLAHAGAAARRTVPRAAGGL